jgi:hypothetical protein
MCSTFRQVYPQIAGVLPWLLCARSLDDVSWPLTSREPWRQALPTRLHLASRPSPRLHPLPPSALWPPARALHLSPPCSRLIGALDEKGVETVRDPRRDGTIAGSIRSPLTKVKPRISRRRTSLVERPCPRSGNGVHPTLDPPQQPRQRLLFQQPQEPRQILAQQVGRLCAFLHRFAMHRLKQLSLVDFFWMRL